MSRERLSNIDTLMLRVDNPASPNMVIGLMVLAAPVPRDRLLEVIRARILHFDRFRQRLVSSRLPLRAPRWEDVTDIDFEYHVKEVTLPPPGDQAALQELVSRLAVTPLDPSRPLWQVHIVGPCDHGCALIWRVHHSLADGVALVHVVLSITDGEPQDHAFGTEEESASAADALLPVRIKTRRQAARRLAHRGLEILGEFPSGEELVQIGVDAAGDLGDLLLSAADTDTVLRGAPSVPKRVSWSDPIPLDEIKMIGRRLGGTVNDILLTATAGALRDYLLARGTALDDGRLRALVPVSLRQPGAEMELGNRIGVVFLPLPVDIADPAERLAELKWRMDNHKGSFQAPIIYAAMETFGRVPARPLNVAVDYLCAKASVVVTNVKGPTERRTLAGAPLEEVMFWIPRYGGIGIAVTILSYAGQVRVGVISDRDTISDPEKVAADFEDDVKALLALALEPKRPPSTEGLSAQLNRTLAALDELLSDGSAT
jgi:diacylglycerol O-acyltransferase / wax synthase